MPDFEKAMQRIEAWFNHEPLDRPPVRFSQHNSEYEDLPASKAASWPDLKARWFDAEFQVDSFIESIKGRRFYGETFPVFSPNLGPNVYAAFHGGDLDYAEVTSWIVHCIHDWDDMKRLKFGCNNEYYLRNRGTYPRRTGEICRHNSWSAILTCMAASTVSPIGEARRTSASISATARKGSRDARHSRPELSALCSIITTSC